MQSCRTCSQPLVRRRRNLLRKILCRGAYKCPECGARTYEYRSTLLVFTRYVSCPRCQTRDLNKLQSPDKLDKMTSNPLRRVLRLLGASLYYCTFCRFQFPDWRSRDPRVMAARRS